jgi:two-component system sensor histidine kinase KdpD
MTRLESGAVKVNKEWMPLEEVVGGALTRLESRLGSREVQVELPSDPLLVPCDAILLEQVFINLVENAVKYSSGAIEIRATPGTGEVAIDVSDRGPGIATGEEERIFDKFHRTAHEGGREGVGLGLTICRAIVSAHGGRIWALNRQGGGATFRFTLPLDGAPPTAPPPETAL